VYMASVPESTNQGAPFSQGTFFFPSFEHVGPYVATLSLLRLTIGLPVWLFSTLVIRDNLLRYFPVLSKVLEAWSMDSHQLVSSVANYHAGENPSTSSDSKVGSKKGRVKFPCRLCEGSHQTYLFPCMKEALHVLEEIFVSQQQLPTGNCKIYTDQPLVDQVVDLVPSSIDPTLPLESEIQVVDLIPPSIDHALPLKS
jgi:hypothetical protein